MKKKLILLLIVLFSFMLVPINTNASKNDKVTIYLFRGKGCGYCRALLTFLNSINDDYADKYELVSYEVWNDQDNYELMKSVSTFLDNEAKGVPYLIIGKDVYPGYADVYDSEIKASIDKLYKTDKDERYDAIAEYEKKNGKLTKKYKTLNFKEALKEEGIKYNEPKKKSKGSVSSNSVIIWNLVFTAVSTAGIILFVNYKFNKLSADKLTTNKKANNKK